MTNEKRKAGIYRDDNDNPVAWVRANIFCTWGFWHEVVVRTDDAINKPITTRQVLMAVIEYCEKEELELDGATDINVEVEDGIDIGDEDDDINGTSGAEDEEEEDDEH